MSIKIKKPLALLALLALGMLASAMASTAVPQSDTTPTNAVPAKKPDLDWIFGASGAGPRGWVAKYPYGVTAYNTTRLFIKVQLPPALIYLDSTKKPWRRIGQEIVWKYDFTKPKANRTFSFRAKVNPRAKINSKSWLTLTQKAESKNAPPYCLVEKYRFRVAAR